MTTDRTHEPSGTERGTAREHNQATPATEQVIAELCEALAEARIQIEYLHGKFRETGSGNAVIARISAALAELTHTKEAGNGR